MRDARGVGTVTQGRAVVENRSQFLADLAKLEGERVTFHVFAGITRKARGYYRAEVLPKIAEQIGQDPDAVHSLLKHKFNPLTVAAVNKQTGEEESYVFGGSFEDLGGAAFAKVLDAVIEWGRDFLGADIREPTTVERQEMFAQQEKQHG